jgi:trehalose 6-phosphate phosphatase
LSYLPTFQISSYPDIAVKKIIYTMQQRPSGIFFDIDGTLSAIAPTPADAILLPGIEELLRKYLETFAMLAVVSGRSALDARRLVGIPGIIYIGNHGLERLSIQGNDRDETLEILPEAIPYEISINAALDTIQQQLVPLYNGMIIERKGITGSIHYRLVQDADRAHDDILDILTPLAQRDNLAIMTGKMVIELRPPIRQNKGTSIAGLVREHHLASALFLGDDMTDIDGFRALHQLQESGACQCISIAVLHPESPVALRQESDIALEGIEFMPSFLRWLLDQTRY